MRVYVPLTLPGLAEAHKTGELGAGPLVAYAVTPALREWYVSDDTEELEYAALGRAALASLRLLDADPDAPRKRVVVAVDVPDRMAAVGPERGPDPDAPGEVRVSGVVRLAKAAAVHVDAPEAETDVTAAARALAAADGGDDDAQAVVDGAEDHELLWFAPQEIASLLGSGV
ncbi:hypothetical protein PYK79_57200 [Streptomyces sp. ID05-04B]|uniref:DUF6912 family protein n=1 Tax=Streptomyces sp. ID05-04B TaxID=3028661 RepID=UPI0029C287B7|nr:hypothetical protein [Streptomyces sp. ID05-04B]MDX5570941.1 hypothetical protein [Streptomyces sp. ID05-04B]